MSTTNGFLIELGVEEIPGRMMESALDQLSRRAESWAEENRLAPAGNHISTYGTPRRLIVTGDLLKKQQKESTELKGPPEQVAYENGEPTQALTGFCNQHGLDPEETFTEDRDGGTYVFARKELPQDPMKMVLEDSFEEVFLNLDWPKSMRWEDSGTRFIRPIRWVFSVCKSEAGVEPINMTVGPVDSETVFHGLRFTDYETFEPPSETLEQIFKQDDNFSDEDVKSSDYFTYMREKTGIIIDQDQRRKVILDGNKERSGANELAEEVGGEPVYDENLLDEVNHLVEAPTPFLGKFHDRFLNVPDQVLIESMQSHQKYFPVKDDDSGELLPYFIGVRNGSEDNLETVKDGNEKVLRARLNDAEFFYEKDLETEYEDYREALKGIIFQDELGTLCDKTERLGKLVHELIGDDKLARVARHCKNDLVTDMVEEFPKLQGTMGKIYAVESGWEPVSARLIEQHYCPRDRTDSIPPDQEGQILSLLDRIDTLIGFLGIGERPTGSSDPHGMRRDAIAVFRLLLEADLPEPLHDLKKLIPLVISTYEDEAIEFAENFESEVRNFFRERLMNFAKSSREAGEDYFRGETERIQFYHDALQSTVSVFWHQPGKADERYEWIVGNWEKNHSEELRKLIEAYQRVDNIVSSEDFESGAVDSRLLQDGIEDEVLENIEKLESKIGPALDEGNPDQVFEVITTPTETINNFFETVMVNADNDDVRVNRLRLLERLKKQYDRILDFSQFSDLTESGSKDDAR